MTLAATAADAPPADAPTTAGPFTRRAVLLMVLVGIFAFSAMGVLSAYAPDFRGGSDTGAHVMSRSAVGYAGLARLLTDMGASVEVSRRPADARDPHWGLLVLTPEVDSDPSKIWDMSVDATPTLIVLPKWNAEPDVFHPGRVLKAGPLEIAQVAAPLSKRFSNLKIARRADAAPLDVTGGGIAYHVAPVDRLQTLVPNPALQTVLQDSRGEVLVAATPDHRAYILSDPDLLNTQGIKDLGAARLALALLQAIRKGDGPIAFDVTLNGLGAPPSLLKLALQPPFLGATLCLVGAAFLMGLHAASSFGAPQRRDRALAFGKRALADNAAALIRQAGREPRMAGRYLSLVRADVGRALGAPRLEPDALDAFLERVGERRGVSPPLSTLNAETSAVRTPAELIRAARNIHRWRGEMTGERR